MRFKLARVNLLVGVQLIEPFLLLPKRIPELFDAFYRALSPRHQLSKVTCKALGVIHSMS